MKQHTLHGLAAQAQVFTWSFGWGWPVAAVLAMAAVLLHAGFLLPAQAELAEAQAELAAASRDRRTPAPEPGPSSEEQQVQAVRSALSATIDSTEVIRRMGELARAEQIAVSQAEYQRQAHESGLLQLHVSQPVKATYPQIKRYVENVLRTMPYVSLDQVGARRDNVGQAQLEARLRWTIWMAPPARDVPTEARR
jgi:hypothetical protein